VVEGVGGRTLAARPTAPTRHRQRGKIKHTDNGRREALHETEARRSAGGGPPSRTARQGAPPSRRPRQGPPSPENRTGRRPEPIQHRSLRPPARPSLRPPPRAVLVGRRRGPFHRRPAGGIGSQQRRGGFDDDGPSEPQQGTGRVCDAFLPLDFPRDTATCTRRRCGRNPRRSAEPTKPALEIKFALLRTTHRRPANPNHLPSLARATHSPPSRAPPSTQPLATATATTDKSSVSDPSDVLMINS
jgi:hypothetical protein